MPSGDAQRTWFPEMVVRLQSKWHEGVSMPTLISLRDELDGMLQHPDTDHHLPQVSDNGSGSRTPR